MIYDCFTFFNELDLLEFRLHNSADQVDRFVLVEADRTFSGEEKPLYFLENRDRFSDFMHKIEHVIVRDMPVHPNAWVREIHQRNAIMRGLGQAKPTDLILISDLDEIPNIPEIEPNISNDDMHMLVQMMCNYYFNLATPRAWGRASAQLMQALCISPQEVRSLIYRPLILNAGWHFSYLMAPEMISQKIKAFSHQEFNSEAYTNPTLIARKMANHEPLFTQEKDSLDVRPQAERVVVEITENFPPYLLQNLEKYRDYILEFDLATAKIREKMQQKTSAPMSPLEQLQAAATLAASNRPSRQGQRMA